MQLTSIITAAALATTALANPLLKRQATGCATSQMAANIGFIEAQYMQPIPFCTWYTHGKNGNGRTRSPLVHMDADTLYNSCGCLLNKNGITYPVDLGKGVRNKYNAFRTPCDQNMAGNITENFMGQNEFCNFFVRIARYFSPLPGLNPEDFNQGCQCILGGPFGSSSSIPVGPTNSTSSSGSSSTSSSGTNSTTSSVPVSASSSSSSSSSNTITSTSSSSSSTDTGLPGGNIISTIISIVSEVVSDVVDGTTILTDLPVTLTGVVSGTQGDIVSTIVSIVSEVVSDIEVSTTDAAGNPSTALIDVTVSVTDVATLTASLL